MNRWVTSIAILVSALSARADVTPMDAELPEDKITQITVKYDGKPVTIGKFTFKKLPAEEFHYNLYLPPDYNKDPKELFPVLFIQSPGGSGNMGAMNDRLKRGRWITVGLEEARNGPWEPIVANFCSAHDDVIKRLRVAEGFKYMTGLSGGGRSSTLMPDLRPGFVGCMPQGAGVWPEYASVPHNPNIGMFLTMGNDDGNGKELAALHKLLPPNMGFYPVYFDGGHTNVPADVAEQAFDWLEWWGHFGSPTQAAAKPMYTQRARQWLAQADESSNEFEKYELIEKADKIASARGVSGDKELSAKLAATKKTMADLAKTDAVKKELPARTAYQKVFGTEYQARRQAKGDFGTHKRFMAEASKAYDGVAKKYPGTVYGDKAAAAATRSKTEADLPMGKQ